MTKGYGVTVEEICWMCPSDLEPYFKAHEVEMDEKDTYVYLAAYRYGVDVLHYTLDHIFNGKKAKSKITEKSIRQEIHETEEANRPLTEEEIIEETKKYFRQRQIDKLNFDLMQIEKQKSGG